MASAPPGEAPPMVSEETKKRVAAAKSYIENMYKVQHQNIQERYARLVTSRSPLIWVNRLSASHAFVLHVLSTFSIQCSLRPINMQPSLLYASGSCQVICS